LGSLVQPGCGGCALLRGLLGLIMGYSGAGSVTRIRDAVSTSRDDAESMQNLAYVVNSANDNIAGLQRTVKLQEKELAEKTEHGAALQRNYETLSRIRKSDQKEFIALKTLQLEERTELETLQQLYAAEQAKTLALERRLQASAAAEQQLQKLQQELSEVARLRDEYQAEAEKQQRAASESLETARAQKLSLDKAARSQQEMLHRAKRAEEELRAAAAAKEALEKAQLGGAAKLAVHERQLKTFFEANEALESDLLKQVQRAAALERRKLELEAEQQTIEAYYQARLDEMQAQYDRLLTEVEGTKSAARDEAYLRDGRREHTGEPPKS